MEFCLELYAKQGIIFKNSIHKFLLNSLTKLHLTAKKKVPKGN